jgi:hypothetical protein
MKNYYIRILSLISFIAMLTIQANGYCAKNQVIANVSVDKKEICVNQNILFPVTLKNGQFDQSISDLKQKSALGNQNKYNKLNSNNLLTSDTTKWTGLADNHNWFNPSNWSNGVPDSTMVAVFINTSPDTLFIDIIKGFAYSRTIIGEGIIKMTLGCDTCTQNCGLWVDSAYLLNKIGLSELPEIGMPGAILIVTVGTTVIVCYFGWKAYKAFKTNWGKKIKARFDPCDKINNKKSFNLDVNNTDTTEITQFEYLTPLIDSSTSKVFIHMILREWNEPLGRWVDVDPDSSLNVPLEVMKGYCVAACKKDSTIVYQGYFNGDTLKIQLTASAGAYTGWNLIGNPFPTYIDCDKITVPPEMDGSFYFWNTENEAYESYTQNIGGTYSRYVEPGKGFFVHVTNNTELMFEPRLYWWPDTTKKKSTMSDDQKILILKTLGNQHSDQLWFNFRNDATEGFDRLLDAYKLFSTSEDVPEIYTTFGGINFSLNSLPFADSVPVCFKSGKSGSYSINLSKNNTGKKYIILEDRKIGKYQNLTSSPEYQFQYQTGEPIERFTLLLRDYPFGIDPFIVGPFNSDYTITAGNSLIIINSMNIENIGELMVYNLLGQLMVKTSLHYGINTVNVALNSEYCIVKICDQKNVINQKVYMK